MNIKINFRHPSLWVPTLYFTEALPYFMVMTLSVIMYTRMGLSNTEQALYTSWLYLPWVIKPLWSPLVDAFRTKRWWIIAMQMLIGASLAGVALTLDTSMWLRLSLAFFWLVAFSSSTHDIAADGFYILSLNKEDQAFYVGFRSSFYRIGSLFCQGLVVVMAGHLEDAYGISVGWSITMGLLSALLILLALTHSYLLPKSESETTEKGGEKDGDIVTSVIQSFRCTWRGFFSRPAVVPALLFMLLFRLPEAQLAKMAQPFMLHGIQEGGLGLTTADVGEIYGTMGVIGLLAGGMLGGWLVSRHGLRRWLWPMVAAISLPDLVYVYLAYAQPTEQLYIWSSVVLEQFGYGFGFTAYMLFLVRFSQGENCTSVFSLCTALQALGMMIPGMFAGYLADQWGFPMFFVWVCLCTVVTFVVSAFVKVE